jgi:hypothetical protein
VSSGPIIGGFVIEKKNFRWLEYVMLFFVAATWLYSLWIKETYKPILIEQQNKRLGMEPPPKSTKGPGSVKVFLTVTLRRPLLMIFTEPIVLFFCLYVGVDFGILFTFFASYPLVYAEVYGFNDAQVGLAFIPIMIGCLIATVTFIVCDKYLYQKHAIRADIAPKSDNNAKDEENTPAIPLQIMRQVEPEHRLYSAMLGSIGLPVGLFWFAWTARPDIHWASSMVATMVFAWGNLCVFVSLSHTKSYTGQPNTDEYLDLDSRCVISDG